MKQSMRLVLLLAPATAWTATLRYRDLGPATGLSGGWTYSGCYIDSVPARVLNSAFRGDDHMSAGTCTAFCASEGYSVAGVEYSSECFCGTALPPQAAENPSTCNMPCSGDPGQICGGPDRLSVYTRPEPAGPQTNPGLDGWQSLGCYSDSVSARSLPRLGAAGDQMTVAVCATACVGSKYFGVEYAAECFCGDNIENGGASVADGCTMSCKGNRDELCGGSNRLNLYQVVALAASSSITPIVSPTVSPSPVIMSSIIPDVVSFSSASSLAATPPLDTPTLIASSSSLIVSSSLDASAPLSSSSLETPSPTPSSSLGLELSSSPTPLSSPSSPIPSPPPGPQPICAPTIPTGGQINNGGFELGPGWTRLSTSNAVSALAYGRAYEGCFSMRFIPMVADVNVRSVAIRSDATITPGSTHTLTFYLGRRVPTGSSNAIVNMRVAVPAGVSWTQSFQVCSGDACNLPGTGGSMWRKYQAKINFLSGQKLPLQITTTWSGAVQQDGSDDVLIDGIFVT